MLSHPNPLCRTCRGVRPPPFGWTFFSPPGEGPSTDPETLGTLFEAGVLLAIPLGIGLIFFGSALLAGVGVVLVILGPIGLMPALQYTVMRPESAGSEYSRPLAVAVSRSGVGSSGIHTIRG